MFGSKARHIRYLHERIEAWREQAVEGKAAVMRMRDRWMIACAVHDAQRREIESLKREVRSLRIAKEFWRRKVREDRSYTFIGPDGIEYDADRRPVRGSAAGHLLGDSYGPHGFTMYSSPFAYAVIYGEPGSPGFSVWKVPRHAG